MMMLLGLFPLAGMTWTDIRTRRIPPPLSFLLISCGALNAATGGATLMEALEGFLIAGAAILIPSLFLGRGNAIGGGDVWLCAGLGALLGAVPALLTICAALILMTAWAKAVRATALPFAPFVLFVYLILMIRSWIC